MFELLAGNALRFWCSIYYEKSINRCFSELYFSSGGLARKRKPVNILKCREHEDTEDKLEYSFHIELFVWNSVQEEYEKWYV